MAGKTTAAVRTFVEHPRVKRPGVHAKSKHSNLKSSKNYEKAYRGQGR